jgi:hypothetical protein
LKWTQNESPGPRHAITTDGKWAMWQDGDGSCGLVRLGVKRGDLWDGSEVVAVGSRDVCLEAMNERDNRG